MPRFEFKARESSGKTVESAIEAPSRKDAIRLLSTRGLSVTSVSDAAAASAAAAKAAARRAGPPAARRRRPGAEGGDRAAALREAPVPRVAPRADDKRALGRRGRPPA